LTVSTKHTSSNARERVRFGKPGLRYTAARYPQSRDQCPKKSGCAAQVTFAHACVCTCLSSGKLAERKDETSWDHRHLANIDIPTPLRPSTVVFGDGGTVGSEASKYAHLGKLLEGLSHARLLPSTWGTSNAYALASRTRPNQETKPGHRQRLRVGFSRTWEGQASRLELHGK
jgi:hypothetical protein